MLGIMLRKEFLVHKCSDIFSIGFIYLSNLLQIYPCPQVQKADRADQRGEVGPE